MKKIFFAAVFFISTNLFAQKDFEGSIKYQGLSVIKQETSDAKDDTINLEIYFAPNRIKIVSDKRENVIIYIDSAKAYVIDNDDKEYRVKKLNQSKPFAKAQVETIAGYTATPDENSTSILGMFGGSTQFWLADNLFYNIPPALIGNEEFLMVQKNKIMLKVNIGKFRFMNGGDEDEEETNADDGIVATITATEVKPGPIDPSIFTIPVDYKEESHDWAIDTTAVMVDTAAWVPDTVVVANPVKPVPIKKKPTPAPVKPKTTTKQPARKP
jgi:hypothetical protein